MASTTPADASASPHAAPPPGLMLPVQALTTGFVHEALSLPLHASQTPLAAPLPTVGMPTLASAGVPGATAGASAAPAPAEAAVGAASTALGLLGGGASPDASQALFAGPAAQAASPSPVLPAAAASMVDSAASVASSMQSGAGGSHAVAFGAAPVHAAPATAGMAAYGPAVFAPGAVADDTHSRQGVRIGDVGVMLTYEDSSELTDLPELYYLPNAPVWVKGLANLHGNLVPVFDVAQYLGVQCGDQAAAGPGHAVGANKPMLLVLGHGADAAGIVIAGIPQRLVPMPQQQTDTDTAPALLMPHIQGAYFINEQLWFDLNCSSLLDMLEQAMMQQA